VLLDRVDQIPVASHEQLSDALSHQISDALVLALTMLEEER
jgi:hypothetical protein